MKPAPGPRRPASPRRVGRFALGCWRDQRGATAVEFAIIAAPLFFMVFALIELGVYFMVQITLDNATAVAARQLRTGQIVADGNSDALGKQAFLTAVCNNMSWLQNQCQNGANSPTGVQYLVVDVRTLNSFANNTAPPMVQSGAMNTSNFCYYSGSSGSAVEFRAFYRWQLLTPMLTSSMQTFTGGVAELQSTQVFQVEPNNQTNPGSGSC